MSAHISPAGYRQAPPEALAGDPGIGWTEGLPLAGMVMNFDPGQEIYAEGMAAERFFKVTAGCVRTCKYSGSGRRQVEAFYGPGEVFGLEADGAHRLTAEAVSGCTLVAYRSSALTGGSPADGRLFREMFALAMRDASRAQDHSVLLGRACAAEKVAIFLKERARRGAAGWSVTLEMSRYDIADYLGLTVETISRVLSRMEKDGLITLKTPRTIAIRNLAALTAEES